MGLKGTATGGGGEIIQVQGGHIIRAMGRKDRHSKVFTAKGPRDRRVRLSAHTAIQFYDVQDRLGFDRPSKAVDWLINKAKASIDKLAHLPPWNPPTNNSINNNIHANNNVGGLSCTEVPVPDRTGSIYNQDGHAVGDCMKSLFPINSSSGEGSQMAFQSYQGNSQIQDLCLSLHTVQDDQGPGPGTHNSGHGQDFFPGSASMGFNNGSSGWTQNHDMGRFTRMLGWASTGGCGGEGEREGRGGIMFNPPPLFPQQSGCNNFQRGTLQSSFYPLVGPGIGPGSESFMGFCNPSQQIQVELHGGSALSNRASSSSLSPDDSSQH